MMPVFFVFFYLRALTEEQGNFLLRAADRFGAV